MGKLNVSDLHQELLFHPQPGLIEEIVGQVSVQAGFIA